MSPSTEQRENREFAAETKFILTPAVAAQVRNWAHARLAPDPNAVINQGNNYQITSLYFDTDQFDVFHRRGSYRRAKYRIRRYDQSEIVFLERKLKTRGLVTKRRSAIRLHELSRLSEPERLNTWPGYWYWQRLRLRRFRPVCQISYERIARVAMTDRGPIRLTLDEGLRSAPVGDLGYVDDRWGLSLLENRYILELKYFHEMPVLFKLLVEEFALNPQPVSKYRLAVTALGLTSETTDRRNT
ncbi:MAG TPA: polyphosphate polymerase domain-containing protein, partial [Candidatus Paceibacterota bacterium]|nr:polyphosphate polymerase domain-containing protein [Candidatus Paceibacterota bacterium]